MRTAVPLLSWGVGPLPPSAVDVFARRELAEHTAALCRLLHRSGDPASCTACSRLRTPAPTGPVGSTAATAGATP